MTKTALLYGGSLYDLAAQENLEEKLLEESGQIRKLFWENPEYVRLLSEPSVAIKERLGLIEEAFGESADRYLVNFLKLLCERGLLGEFGGCCEAYTRRFNADRGIAEALVTSAVELTQAQKDALAARLEKMSGKSVRLVCRTDPSVLGGLRVELEGKELDGTVKGRLAGIGRKLKETTV